MLSVLLLAFAVRPNLSEEPPRRVAEWSVSLGNHRARVSVDRAADAVRVHLVWRRRDSNPDAKQILVVPAGSERRLENVLPIRIERASGDLVFQPAAGAGEYFIYTLPFKTTGSPYFPTVTYTEAAYHPDSAWLARNHCTPAEVSAGATKSLPSAKVVAFEDRGEFNRYDPMELIAAPDETASLLVANPGEPFLLFPEDRYHPIKMTDDLPARWTVVGPARALRESARPGEYVAFQAGLWAARAPLRNVRVRFGALRDSRGRTVSLATFNCLDTGGVDWLGRRFSKRVDVPRGKIAALWCGVQLPASCRAGDYSAEVAVVADGVQAQRFRLRVAVAGPIAKDGGDADPHRMSRLRWLDSTIGLDDEVVAPYTPLKLAGNRIKCLGRQVSFGPDGLPTSIRSGSREILAEPIRLVADRGVPTRPWQAKPTRTVTRGPGAITRHTSATQGALAYECTAKMEADGYVNFKIALAAREPTELKDVRLEIPIRRDVATYMMGMGRKGGYRPADWKWDWNRSYANNMVWIGDVGAGLQCKLKGEDDTWDLFKLSHLPAGWANNGRGGCEIRDAGPAIVLLSAYSGARSLQAGETIHLNFGLLVTPVKPLDPAHWSWRYDHEYVPPEKAKTNGATIVNIQQGNELNPNINYPFVAAEKLKAYVARAHKLGLKVKIYYTVRELSNRVVEMWALRSLGQEVFTDGPGGGDSWLQEHLVDHYRPAWHTPLANGEVDAAIATVGLSRWHNYYLEGLRWLIDNVGIDGLYLDGIGYDREIMKRVRKVMDRTKRGCLIDFHCGNSFQPQYGMNSPANQFMEHFPYMSSLWLGEGYDYNETPDYWLVEVSGIPFGMYGEMLEGNGNPWRGMLYGMTARYYSGADPKPIWQLWDSFGIAEAKMLGYWSPACPVRTDNPNVLATAYVREGRTLISLASWNKTPVSVRLKIDWKALGLDPDTATMSAPPVKGFQPESRFTVGDPIPVEPAKGWMLLLRSLGARKSALLPTR